MLSILACGLTLRLQGASVLTHEAVVDALWDVKLKSILMGRYPRSTPDELKRAHGYAYGGSIIQDLGYYPHGNKKFSDLTHYVRTGAFIQALVKEANSLDELAFALGSLSHYSSDIEVHRSATNPGEAILYPKLRRRFGPIVTYEKNPAAHLKTEFGFDVLEVAKGRFAPEAYHDFIGFYVAKDLLGRAFHDTYGLDLQDLFSNFDRVIESYRHDVSKLIPEATRIAWAQREKQIESSQPGITRSRFVYVMRRSSYEREWGTQYDRPSAGDRFLAVLLKLLPPIGPLRALQFRMPTPPVEKLFEDSFTRCAGDYQGELASTSSGGLHLEDINYDLGKAAKPGEYRLEDEAYASLLDKLAAKKFSTATPQIKQDVLAYFGNPDAPIAAKARPKEWARVQAELQTLRETGPVADSAPLQTAR